MECLSKKKLFDVEDRPLRLHKHMDEQQQEEDTFFRCISTALTCVDKHHVKIRSACVMRFITLMFNVPPECCSVAIFLKEYAADANIKGLAYHDRAIQVCVFPPKKKIIIFLRCGPTHTLHVEKQHQV